MQLQCNLCWVQLEPDVKSICTPCLHLFCSGCIQKLLESNQCCSVCEGPLSAGTVKGVQVAQNASKFKLALCGQTPEVIMQTALNAITFWNQQMEVTSNKRERTVQQRLEMLHQQCSAKVAQVHAAYSKMRNKANTLTREKEELHAENQELSSKYQQRSSQVQQLKSQVQQVQAQLDQASSMTSSGMNMGPAFQGGHNRSMAGNGQMVTTVHQRTRVFNLPDMPAGTPPVYPAFHPSGSDPGRDHRRPSIGMLTAPGTGMASDMSSPGNNMLMSIGSAMPGAGGPPQRKMRLNPSTENAMASFGHSKMAKPNATGGAPLQLLRGGGMGSGGMQAGMLQPSQKPNIMGGGLGSPYGGFTNSM
ncbi:hypothetical protein V8C86DRAFT_916770 [Haematococcus lacustris]